MPITSIEALVAVHDPRRPLVRCLRSVLQQPALDPLEARVGVCVVVHNTDPEPIRAQVTAALGGADIRWEELHDGIASPAGPFNRALDTSTADIVALLGSDDVLEPGALGAWSARARQTRADVVVAPLRTPGGIVSTPYLRPGRREVLDPLADGLVQRTAPLGLLRLAHVRDLGVRLTEGYRSGEDIEPGLRLWFGGGRITYPYGAPAYRVLDGTHERVSTAAGSLEDVFGVLRVTTDAPWAGRLARPAREAIAVKLARQQLLRGIEQRAAGGQWTTADAAFVADLTARLAALSGTGLRSLSRAERALLDDAAAATDLAQVQAAIGRSRGSRVQILLPQRPWDALASTSRLRTSLRQQLTHRSGAFDHPPAPRVDG